METGAADDHPPRFGERGYGTHPHSSSTLPMYGQMVPFATTGNAGMLQLIAKTGVSSKTSGKTARLDAFWYKF